MGRPDIPKVLAMIHGDPMIVWAMRGIEAALRVDRFVIAAREADLDRMNEAISGCVRAPVQVVAGGDERHVSVRRAVDAAEPRPDDMILIHDADRPFVDRTVVRLTLAKAVEAGAAICALDVTDTLKEVSGDGLILRTHPRTQYRLAQTPQIFRSELLARAYGAVPPDAATDEALLVERAGVPVYAVAGSPYNIKITTRDDLALAERIAPIVAELRRDAEKSEIEC